MRALLLQVLYSVRSERALMDQMDLHLGLRWFVGLTFSEPVWEASTFSKNRERLLGGDIAQEFLHAVLAEARRQHWLSDERFVVDGTLIEAGPARRVISPRTIQRRQDKARGGGASYSSVTYTSPRPIRKRACSRKAAARPAC